MAGERPNDKKKRNTVLFCVLLIAILGFVSYANSLSGSFLWDDESLVFARSAGTLGRDYDFYRPFQLFTYKIDRIFWGTSPAGYHLTNIFLHIAAALAVFWLISTLYGDRLLSLLTAALFTVHPIHTGAVAYISGRADPLTAVFMLLAMIFYIKFTRSKETRLYVFMIISYILAILARENSIILPLLILLYHYSFRKKVNIKAFLTIFIISASYAILRLATLKAPAASVLHSGALPLFDRIPLAFAAITNYIGLLLLPFGLHMEYADTALNAANTIKALAGIAISSSLLFYAYKRRPASIPFFSILWFFIALAPQLNIYPINAYMAEHWLYLPSIGFFLLVSRGLTLALRHEKMKMAAMFCAMALITFYTVLTIGQNSYWNNGLDMYKRTLGYSPNSYRVMNNLGNEYSKSGNRVKAANLFRKAIMLKPGYAYSYINLGNLYKYDRDYKRAMAYYKKALELEPDYAGTYYNIANVYAETGNNKQAESFYSEALRLDPGFLKAARNLEVLRRQDKR